jgi:hypothetical protein
MKYRNFLLFPFRNFSVFSISKFFCFFEISSEEISKFGKNRNARTSATTSVENDQPKSLSTIVQTRAQNQSLRAGVRHLGSPFFGDPKELYQKFRHPDHGHQGCGPRRAWPPWSSRCGRWAAGCRKSGAGATSAKQEIPKGPSGHRGERAKVPAKFIHTYVQLMGLGQEVQTLQQVGPSPGHKALVDEGMAAFGGSAPRFLRRPRRLVEQSEPPLEVPRKSSETSTNPREEVLLCGGDITNPSKRRQTPQSRVTLEVAVGGFPRQYSFAASMRPHHCLGPRQYSFCTSMLPHHCLGPRQYSFAASMRPHHCLGPRQYSFSISMPDLFELFVALVDRGRVTHGLLNFFF